MTNEIQPEVELAYQTVIAECFSQPVMIAAVMRLTRASASGDLGDELLHLFWQRLFHSCTSIRELREGQTVGGDATDDVVDIAVFATTSIVRRRSAALGFMESRSRSGSFGNPGEAARDISYRVQVHAAAPKTTIDDLIRATDSVTEVQNTIRAGCDVRLEQA